MTRKFFERVRITAQRSLGECLVQRPTMFSNTARAISAARSCFGQPPGFGQCPGCHFHAAMRVASRCFNFGLTGGVLSRDESRVRCAGCDYQVSVTAGTILQDSRLSLTLWFRAVWWVTSQKNGVSAVGLQRVLGVKSYKTAGRRCTSCVVPWCAPAGIGSKGG